MKIQTFNDFLNESQQNIYTFTCCANYLENLMNLCNLAEYSDEGPFDDNIDKWPFDDDELDPLAEMTTVNLEEAITVIEEYDQYDPRDYDGNNNEFFDEYGYDLYPAKKGKARELLNNHGPYKTSRPKFDNFGVILKVFEGAPLIIIDYYLFFPPHISFLIPPQWDLFFSTYAL